MVKNSKPNYGYSSGFMVMPVTLGENDLEELEYICSDPAFIEEMTNLAGFFKAHKINELESSLISEQKAALTELEGLTDQLSYALRRLDSDTSELIIEALQHSESPLFFKSIVDGPLTKLSAGIELARRKIEHSTGAPYKESERVTVVKLGRIFEHFGINMEYDDDDEDIGITGWDFYSAVKIILQTGWPSESEWPPERRYKQFQESTVRKLVTDYLA